MKSLHQAIAFTALIFLIAGLTVADTTTVQKKAATKKKKKSTASGRKTGTSARSTTAKRGPATATQSKSRQSWRTRQLQPTPERYKEIQQALASKGYLKGEPAGAWNQESIDALRRFQQDQGLDSTGRIDSLSLIALGLGPKHETASAVPPLHPTPTETQAPPPAAN